LLCLGYYSLLSYFDNTLSTALDAAYVFSTADKGTLDGETLHFDV